MREFGITARLVMLTAAAVTPLVLLLAGGIVYSYGDALDRAKIDLRKSAVIAASHLSDPFQDARARLDMIRNLAEVRRSSGASCDAFMSALQRAHPQFKQIGLIDRSGTTVCRGQAGGAYLLDNLGLVDTVLAMEPGGFMAGTFAAGLAQGDSTVLAAMPLSHVGGKATGIIYAVIDLSPLLESARQLAVGVDRTVVLLEAASARVLARWPNPVAFGTPMPSHPLLSFVRDNPDGGVVEIGDIDGTPRIFGAAPVREAGSAGLMLLVGETRAATIAVVNFRSLVAVLLAFLALGLAIVATSWLGSDMLVRPMRRLVHMASRIGAGEFEARTEIERWQAPEFRELASTLDVMAVRLEEGRLAEKAVAASETRYRLLAENTADMIVCIGPNGECTFVSGACFELVGFRPEELLGKDLREGVHPDDRGALRSMADRLRAGGETEAMRYRSLHRLGYFVWVEASVRRIHDSDELVLAVRDASHRKAMEDHLEAVNHRLASLAATDELTGLPNRRTFNAALAQEIARCARSAEPISLVLIDVDRFKAFNDGYGHQAGDVCLTSVAKALGLQVRRTGDLVARYGGEEFVAVLPDATMEGAQARAEAMRLAVRQLDIEHAGSEHGRVTVSIGIACLPDARGEDAAAILLRQADQALYAAKAAGRDQVELFTADAVELRIKRSV